MDRGLHLCLDGGRLAVCGCRHRPLLPALSDRGSQYASEQFQRLMADHGVACSMSRSGNVWDNAAMEASSRRSKPSAQHASCITRAMKPRPTCSTTSSASTTTIGYLIKPYRVRAAGRIRLTRRHPNRGAGHLANRGQKLVRLVRRRITLPRFQISFFRQYHYRARSDRSICRGTQLGPDSFLTVQSYQETWYRGVFQQTS